MQLRINLLRTEQRRERWRVAQEGQREDSAEEPFVTMLPGAQLCPNLPSKPLPIPVASPVSYSHSNSDSSTPSSLFPTFANYTCTTCLKFPFSLFPVLPLCSYSHFLTWLTPVVLAALPPETSFRLSATGLIFLS